ncbi:unnamed protein product [Strongylus vulgaris]|uniref:Uncharacterized protein n=1 Tax=Strongylus vulgaris TaxID=40348 RepID=A0A3P7IJX7_STRVU|nr:unnamed protein product [Strongylus vulgaris]
MGTSAISMKQDIQEFMEIETDTETNIVHEKSFSEKRYRAGPDDPFRLKEEKRIAVVRNCI